MAILAINKDSHYSFHILEELEAGLELQGPEVKSIKQKKISLKGSFISFIGNELYLKNCFISPYQARNQQSYDPMRLRKILLKRKEIDSLLGKIKSGGLTLIPINVYTKKALIKIRIGLARGKKKQDKRESIKKREIDRKINLALKQSLRG